MSAVSEWRADRLPSSGWAFGTAGLAAAGTQETEAVRLSPLDEGPGGRRRLLGTRIAGSVRVNRSCKAPGHAHHRRRAGQRGRHGSDLRKPTQPNHLRVRLRCLSSLLRRQSSVYLRQVRGSCALPPAPRKRSGSPPETPSCRRGPEGPAQPRNTATLRLCPRISA